MARAKGIRRQIRRVAAEHTPGAFVPKGIPKMPFSAFIEAATRKGATIPDALHYKRVHKQGRIKKIEFKPGHGMTCIQKIINTITKVNKLYEAGRLKPETLVLQAELIEAHFAMQAHEALMREDQLNRELPEMNFEKMFPPQDWKRQYLSAMEHRWEEMCGPLQETLIARLVKKH